MRLPEPKVCRGRGGCHQQEGQEVDNQDRADTECAVEVADAVGPEAGEPHGDVDREHALGAGDDGLRAVDERDHREVAAREDRAEARHRLAQEALLLGESTGRLLLAVKPENVAATRLIE